MMDLAKCPACGHDKHIGRVCGFDLINDLSVDGAGPCPCHEEARKASAGKIKGYHLLPWDALSELAQVYEYGARKYAPNSWREVPNAIEEYTNAMFRHWRKACELGPDALDEEALSHGFKIRHMAMFLWNANAVTALTQGFVSGS